MHARSHANTVMMLSEIANNIQHVIKYTSAYHNDSILQTIEITSNIIISSSITTVNCNITDIS